jgi:hypothetical protein
MGDHGTYFCSDVDAGWHFARVDPGGLSRWRFDHERDHTFDAVLPACSAILPAVREENRYWDAGVIDVALFNDLPRAVDGLVVALLATEHSAWNPVDVHASVAGCPRPHPHKADRVYHPCVRR